MDNIGRINGLGQIKVPPFGLDMTTSGIILVGTGLVSGVAGVYLAIEGARAVGKRLPTFWQFIFGTGGLGVAMTLLGAVPLVALGSIQLIGGEIVKGVVK